MSLRADRSRGNSSLVGSGAGGSALCVSENVRMHDCRSHRTREEVDEHVGGGAPHGLVVEFEEVQRAIHRRAAPTFHPVRAGSGEFAQRCPENAVDFAGARLDVRPMIEHRYHGHDVAATDDRVEVREFADDGGGVGIEADLLVGFA